jgi:arylsulfatase A-like enzyme
MKQLLLPLLVITFASCQAIKQGSTRQKPNIIVIMTDDHAIQAISAYGSKLIKTPNLDRLANEGIRFNQAYVTNSICAPARAVLLTGKFSHLNSVTDNADVFDSTQVTFPKILQMHGYTTAVIGKWHLKSNPTGFDYWKILPGQGDYYNPVFITKDGSKQESGYVTDLVTDFAIHYLDSIRDRRKPFMLMYQHKAPHRDWWPGPEHLRALKDQHIPEPANLFDDYAGRGNAAKEAEMRISDHMGLSNDLKIKPDIVERTGHKEFEESYKALYHRQHNRMTDEQRAAWDAVYNPINSQFELSALQGEALTKWKYRRYMEDYLGSVQSVDDNIGRLMKYMQDRGLMENTLVIYTSDQGFYLGEHGWFDKRFMYEESFRTPLIVRWAGRIKAGSVNTDLVQNIDIAQTILEAAKINPPSDMQGKSILPLFAGDNKNWRDALYYHYYEYPGVHAVKRHYGIKTKRYKLIHFYYDVDEWELYDLEKDPSEMRNVFNNPAYGQVKIELQQRLLELRKQYGDSDSITQSILKRQLERRKQN